MHADAQCVEAWVAISDNGPDISTANKLAEAELHDEPYNILFHTDCFLHQYHLIFLGLDFMDMHVDIHIFIYIYIYVYIYI